MQDTTSIQPSKTALRAGWALSALCMAFLLFDAIAKICKEIHTVQTAPTLGWDPGAMPMVGAVLLIFTLVYIYPKTTILGALLVTGYLGGAVATQWRIGNYNVFPIIFALLMWGGLYLRYPNLRRIIPING